MTKYQLDLMRSILWQYENTNTARLVERMQKIADALHGEFFENWESDVFNLKTANSFGLSLWAEILDEPLKIQINQIDDDTFGFGTELNNHANFGNGGFQIVFEGLEGISEEHARKVLISKWFILTEAPTIPNINKLLAFLFDGASVFIVDGLNMTATYIFETTPGYRMRWLITNREFLPRPAGVKTSNLIIAPLGFGFGENHLNFENGGFTKREYF